MGQLLDPDAVAELLHVSRRTLDRWRYERKGPPFRKLGTSHNARVRYDEDELRAWVEGDTATQHNAQST